MTVSTLILLAIASLSTLTATQILRMPQAPGRNAFALAGLAAVWWSVCVAFRLNSTDLADKVFFAELAWLGIIATPLFWSAGFLDYAGFRRAAGLAPKVIIFTISGFACAAALTNDWHHLIYSGITNYERPTFSHGWLFFVLLSIAYLAMALASLLAVSQLKRSSSLHRRQLVGLLVATFMPLLANAAFNLFGFRIFNDDPTPFAFGATLLAVYFILRRDKLLIAPPIARDVIFSVMTDPIVVIDREGLVLETNPAAERLPGFGGDTVGTQLAADHPLAAFVARETFSGSGTSMIALDDVSKVYEVSSQPLAQWGREGCLMLVLRDVTRREAALKKYADASRDLKLRLEENLRLQQQLEHEALHDHLTGLHNRRHASAAVPDLLARTEPGQETAFIVIDLDHFKQVNDRFGHDVGDRVLVEFARILKVQIPAQGMAFRHGGEEFLVVLPGLGRKSALELCSQWRRAYAAVRIAGLDGMPLGFSAGIAMAPGAGRTLADCTKAADVALYRAKIGGRGRDVVWGEHLDIRTGGPQPATGGKTSKVA